MTLELLDDSWELSTRSAGVQFEAGGSVISGQDVLQQGKSSWVRGPPGKEECDDSPRGRARPHPGTVVWCVCVIVSVCDVVSVYPTGRQSENSICWRPSQERALPEAEPGGNHLQDVEDKGDPIHVDLTCLPESPLLLPQTPAEPKGGHKAPRWGWLLRGAC